MAWSLTEHLLSLSPDEYKAATQAPFLQAAGEGRLPKATLGRWLANDRLYIHAYIRAAGRLLTALDLPDAALSEAESPETRLVDWIVEALAGVRREERFFLDVAKRYGLDVDLTTRGAVGGGVPGPAQVPAADKLPGLTMIEGHFASVGQQPARATANAPSIATAATPPPILLPWLEGAVVFWATERCYLDAWSWAKSRQIPTGPGPSLPTSAEDADGGALRREFIPNWSSPEFAEFVAKLGRIIDDAVARALESASGEGGAEEVKKSLLVRLEGKWSSFIAAEAAFWPDV